MKLIEPKIGEVFSWNGKRYICKKQGKKSCFDCPLDYPDCLLIVCGEFERKDGVDVLFEEVEDAKES